MKDLYGKTNKSTYFSAFSERILVRMQDFSYMADTFSKRPLVLPAIVMITGCFLSFVFESFLPAVVLGVMCLIFSICGSFLKVTEIKTPNKTAYVSTGVFLCVVLIYCGFVISSALNASKPLGEGRFNARVTSVSYDLAGDVDITVRLDGGTLAKVNFYNEKPSVITGTSMVICGKLKEPETAGNPGEFDYREYLKTRGILYVISCDRFEVVEEPCFPIDLTGKLQLLFFEFRRRAFECISCSFDEISKGLCAAVCIGDKSLVDEGLKRDFKMSGCSHLLAVSGTHFSGFLACLPAVLDTLKIKRGKALVIYVIFCILTGCLTGWGNSVTRAAFMSICAFALRDWLSGLSLASMVMVISDPFCPLSSGFQMSFCAVIAIKMLGAKITAFLMKLHMPEKLAGVVSPCVSASLGMIPFWTDISMKPDLEHLLIQIVGTFIAQMACTCFVPCVILCFLIPVWAQYLSAPLLLCLKLIYYTVSAGSMVSERGGLTIHLSKSFLVILAITVFLLFMPPCILKRLFLKISCFILAVMIGVEAFDYIHRPVCTVVFADVGQGDCCLIMTPESTCLIDGGTYDEGATTVRDILDYYGIYRVDVCFMSHWDVDHAGGIAALDKQGRIGSVLASYVPSADDHDKDVEEFFKSTGLYGSDRDEYISSLELVLAGDRIVLSSDVYIDVLYPFENKRGGNEDSMVAMLHISGNKDTAILFTGDIGMETEKILLENNIPTDCDILKVAHHGSKYSSSEEFIYACSPDISVISVGKNNFYGHTAPDTLDRLTDYGCEVFRTDTEGAVIISY